MRTRLIRLVTPASSAANNGNWQTAARWARMLRTHYRVEVVGSEARADPAQVDPGDAESGRADPGRADLLIALHARRSAPAVAGWVRQSPRRPVIVVLTGTDLYRDLDHDVQAQACVAAADRLVVLNEQAPRRLAPALRARSVVSLQSAPQRIPLPRPRRWLRAVAVGHLREEKGVTHLLEAARRLAGRPDVRIDHLGAGLDPALAEQAQALGSQSTTYRWLGAVDHATTLRRIRSAHLLVHPSRMEGGAHAIIEAVRSATPVVATRIGYVEVDDAAALAAMMARCRDEPSFLESLTQACARRAPLFDPALEQARLCTLVAELLT
jgi:putative glycosyltransferase (TIGR04348 family)